ncbi:hypothetical protein EJB05_33213, partial [Eragrostis curvula]
MSKLLVFLLLLCFLAAGEATREGEGSELAVVVDPSWRFPNQRLRDAYVALQTWKQQAIFSDPKNFTADWVGPAVCNYTGVYCAALPRGAPGAGELSVAGVDLNHGDIAGWLPPELGLLVDLALLHLNSNRFCGLVPDTLRALRLLAELDLSNNRFVGLFPRVVLDLPRSSSSTSASTTSRRRPSRALRPPLDAIFLNHNRLRSPLPDNFGNSPASVIVLADNSLGGCLPASLGNMSDTLNEILLINNGLSSCFPPEVGMLREVTVFDVSFNSLVGPLPSEVAGMRSVEQLDVAHNNLSGTVPQAVCALPRLQNLTIAYNFFTGEPPACARVVPADGDRRNCLPNRPAQRPPQQCAAFYSRPPVDCAAFQCKPFHPPPPPAPVYPGPLPPVYPMPYASPPPPPPCATKITMVLETRILNGIM